MKKLLSVLIFAIVFLSMPAPDVSASGYETVLYLGGNGNLDQTYTLRTIFDGTSPAPIYSSTYDMILGSSPSGFNGTGVEVTWTDPRTINYVRMCWTANKTRTGATDLQEFLVNGIRVASYSIPNALGVNTGCIAASIATTTGGLFRIEGTVRSNASNEGGAYVLSDGSYYRITLIELSVLNETPTLTRPIHSSFLEYEFNHEDSFTYVNTTMAGEIPVFAPEPSTVTAVRRITVDDCVSDLFQSIPNCGLSISEDFISNNDRFYNIGAVIIGNTADVIELTGESGFTYRYILAAPRVTVGQEIDNTCYMGKTTALYPALASQEIYSNAAVTAVVMDSGTPVNTLVPDEEYFTIDPPNLNAAPCDAPPAYEQCLGNAIVYNSTEWTSSGVTWLTDRAIISPTGFIEKTVSLYAGSPYVYVYAKGIGGDANASITWSQVTLPTNTTVADVTYPSRFVERSATITLATDDMVTLRISNTADRNIEIKSACITTAAAGEEAPPTAPEGTDPPEETPNQDLEEQACNLLDYRFDSSSSWSTTGGEWKQGEWRLDSGDSISQSVSLDSGNWYISVLHRASYLADVTLDIQDGTDNVVIEFNVGGGWQTLDTITERDYASYQNQVISTAMYNLASPYSGTFQIRVTISGMAGAKVALMSACIGASEYDETGTQLFDTKCGSAINTPSGESNAVWTSWLWSNLDQFYNCDLMSALNSIYDLILEQYKLFGWVVRYWQTSIKLSLLWLQDQVFPWLAGYFSNMGTGNTTTIVAGNTCDNLFCTVLGIGELIVAPIQSLIDGVIGAVNRVFDVLETVLDFLIGALQVVVDAVDAAVLLLIDTLYIVIEALENLFYFLLNTLGQVIDLLIMAITLLIDIVRAIIDTGKGVLDYLLAIMNDVRNLVASLLNLWNDTPPATLPFVPSCSTNPENGMCIAFWMMEHTIFSGTGALFIPLIISFGSLLGLIWAARKLRTAINTAGGLL